MHEMGGKAFPAKWESEYRILPALMEHVPFLAGIERAAAAMFPSGSIPDHIRNEALPVALLKQGVREQTLWVALDAAGHPVGYALLRFVDGLALLAQVDVLPEHGRQGLGRALIAKAARRAAECGHDALYLTTFTHVPWNAPFYARAGFVRLAEECLPAFLRAVLEEEKAVGLEHRTAMRMSLAGGDPSGD